MIDVDYKYTVVIYPVENIVMACVHIIIRINTKLFSDGMACFIISLQYLDV